MYQEMLSCEQVLCEKTSKQENADGSGTARFCHPWQIIFLCHSLGVTAYVKFKFVFDSQLLQLVYNCHTATSIT